MPDLKNNLKQPAELEDRKQSSPRRIAASQANGRLSNGPSTPEGKLACAKNPTKHGMLAQSVVLAGESNDRFTALLESFIAAYRPATEPEHALVNKMVAAYWRQLRAWTIQKLDFDREINQRDLKAPMAVRATIAFGAINAPGATHNVAVRYETTFDRQFSRAQRDLAQLQSQRDPGVGLDTVPIALTASSWFAEDEAPEVSQTVSNESGPENAIAIKS